MVIVIKVVDDAHWVSSSSSASSTLFLQNVKRHKTHMIAGFKSFLSFQKLHALFSATWLELCAFFNWLDDDGDEADDNEHCTLTNYNDCITNYCYNTITKVKKFTWAHP